MANGEIVQPPYALLFSVTGCCSVTFIKLWGKNRTWAGGEREEKRNSWARSHQHQWLRHGRNVIRLYIDHCGGIEVDKVSICWGSIAIGCRGLTSENKLELSRLLVAFAVVASDDGAAPNDDYRTAATSAAATAAAAFHHRVAVRRIDPTSCLTHEADHFQVVGSFVAAALSVGEKKKTSWSSVELVGSPLGAVRNQKKKRGCYI